MLLIQVDNPTEATGTDGTGLEQTKKKLASLFLALRFYPRSVLVGCYLMFFPLSMIDKETQTNKKYIANFN